MLVMLLSFYAKFTVFWLECMTFQLAFKTTLFFQEEGIEKRVPATIPQEHFGQRILVKCLQLK